MPSDPPWEEFTEIFEGERSLPDDVVRDTTLADWEALLALIQHRAWRAVHLVDGEEGSSPLSAAELFREIGTLKVWPSPGVQINVFPYGHDTIDFDFDTGEIGNQAALEQLYDFIRTLGQVVSKTVDLSHEGAPDLCFLSYDPVEDKFALRP